MNFKEQRALLEKAGELLELIDYAQQRIETRKEYTLNERWKWLYPELVAKNIASNETMARAIDRIYKRYTAIINQLQNLTK